MADQRHLDGSGRIAIHAETLAGQRERGEYIVAQSRVQRPAGASDGRAVVRRELFPRSSGVRLWKLRTECPVWTRHRQRGFWGASLLCDPAARKHEAAVPRGALQLV